jgi:hypothetical protein
MKVLKDILVGLLVLVVGESFLCWMFYPTVFSNGIKRINWSVFMDWRAPLIFSIPFAIFFIVLTMSKALKKKSKYKKTTSDIPQDAATKKVTDERLKLTLRKIKLEKKLKSMPNPNTLVLLEEKAQLEKELSEINIKIEFLKRVDGSWQSPDDFMIAKCPRPTCMNSVEFHKKDINSILHCTECGLDFKYTTDALTEDTLRT